MNIETICRLFIITVLSTMAILPISNGHKSSNKNKQQRVLLISFDGFRYDYIDKYNLKNFKRLVNDGVKAKFMTPQFSTQTYANHWTLITGLYEESHGIVGNTFFDPVFNELFIRNNTNLKWWNASEPLWFTSARNNLKTGAYFWPGSQVIFFNTSMYTTLPYDEKLPFKPKVDTVVDWFTKEGYVFVALYDPQPDYNGHFFGLDSDVFNKTIADLDEGLGYLITKLENANLYNADDFNVIIVSDHGMASTTNIVILDEYVTEKDVTVLAAGGNNIHLKPLPNSDINALLTKLKKLPNVTVVQKSEMPERWHYKNNRRVPDIMLIGQEGTAIYKTKQSFYYYADHGYDNNVVSLRAQFLAKGPAFRKNYKSEDYIENVDVYPLVCYILNIKCLPNNGSIDRTQQFLAISLASTKESILNHSIFLWLLFLFHLSINH